MQISRGAGQIQFAGSQPPSTTKKMLRGAALGLSMLGAVAGGAALTGCSPQQSSYWTNTFTELPAPPMDARLQLGVSTESDGTVFINYVIWDAQKNAFQRKDIHYNTTTMHPGTFSEMGGYTQRIHDGEVLYGGAIVDQAKKAIVLANGQEIDGPTGNIYKIVDGQRVLVKELTR